MQRLLYQLLPFVVAGLVCWLLVAPPEVLGGTGLPRMVGTLLLIALLLMVFFAVVINGALPRDVTLEPLDDRSVDAEMFRRMDEAEGLGFSLAGPVLRVGVKPPAPLVPMVHRDGFAYATFFRTGTVPPKTSFDIVSLLEGGGGLTTCAEPTGSSLPAGRGVFFQVFPGATVADLWQHHIEAMGWLEQQGVYTAPATADQFDEGLRAAINHQRDQFLRDMPRFVAIVVWRSLTSRTPHLGPIREQHVAATTLRQMQLDVHLREQW